jgi:hypothetical protein
MVGLLQRHRPAWGGGYFGEDLWQWLALSDLFFYFL